MSPKSTSKRKTRFKGIRSPSRKGGKQPSSTRSRSSKSTTKTGGPGKNANQGFGFMREFKLQEVPLDRWIDILGVIIGLVGLLIILGLVYPRQDGLVSGWMGAIEDSFGWGMYIFPIGMVVCGAWLVLRRFERVPPFAVERVLGATLLFFVFLAALNFLAGIFSEINGGTSLATNQEGGSVGAKISGSLDTAFGGVGTTIILAAFLLIGLVLFLDKPVAEMFGWLGPAAGRFQNWLKGALLAVTRTQRRGKAEIPGIQTISPFAAAGNSAKDGGGKTVNAGYPGAGESLSYEIKGEAAAWKLPAIDEILELGGRAEYDQSIDIQRARVIEESLSLLWRPGACCGDQPGAYHYPVRGGAGFY